MQPSSSRTGWQPVEAVRRGKHAAPDNPRSSHKSRGKSGKRAREISENISPTPSPNASPKRLKRNHVVRANEVEGPLRALPLAGNHQEPLVDPLFTFPQGTPPRAPNEAFMFGVGQPSHPHPEPPVLVPQTLQSAHPDHITIPALRPSRLPCRHAPSPLMQILLDELRRAEAAHHAALSNVNYYNHAHIWEHPEHRARVTEREAPPADDMPQRQPLPASEAVAVHEHRPPPPTARAVAPAVVSLSTRPSTSQTTLPPLEAAGAVHDNRAVASTRLPPTVSPPRMFVQSHTAASARGRVAGLPARARAPTPAAAPLQPGHLDTRVSLHLLPLGRRGLPGPPWDRSTLLLRLVTGLTSTTRSPPGLPLSGPLVPSSDQEEEELEELELDQLPDEVSERQWDEVLTQARFNEQVARKERGVRRRHRRRG
ncbi:uncharacterized protein BXZ73DRAFT_104324 [Epithele typhae]|uniref:uncharacterized protein n=1 Tax=Epithele typhae TaxID=378194 RepID=UPI00200828DC|nr:uncharacterized protein BXZ73DRAFT_104324 [Epithele typhae]KAH9921703.1 hypothetical protein BXZ73DRAFT_104324 [Epithele typhae]